jgi:hypothetical protein
MAGAERAPRLLALGAWLASIPFWLWWGRDRTFDVDEWSVVDRRWYGGLDSFLEPHNEHISVYSVAVYRFLFDTFGLDDGWPYRLVVLAMHLACAALIYSLVRRRVGDWGAAFAAIAFLFCGRACENVLHAWQMGVVGPVLAGLIAWWALDRDRPWLAALGLVLGIGWGSTIVPVIVGVAAEVLWSRRYRLLWVPGIPLALYALWYVGYGISHTRQEGVEGAPGWAVDAAAAAVGGVMGRGLDFGRPLLVLVVVLAVWRLRDAVLTPRLAGVVGAAASYWLLTGALRSPGAEVPQAADQSRYVYVGVAFVLLAAAEVARGWRPGRRGVAALAVLTAFAVAQGIPFLRDRADLFRSGSDRARAELTALHVVRDRIPADYVMIEGLSDLKAGNYLRAADKYGSAGLTPGELPGLPAESRYFADKVFIAGDARLAPADRPAAVAATPPVVEGPPGAAITTRGGCIRTEVMTDLVAVGQELRIEAEVPTTVELRRYGDVFRAIGDVLPGQPALLTLLPDGVDQPWRVRLTPKEPGPLRACAQR